MVFLESFAKTLNNIIVLIDRDHLSLKLYIFGDVTPYVYVLRSPIFVSTLVGTIENTDTLLWVIQILYKFYVHSALVIK